MNFSSLYEQRQYHKIIICRSYCKSDEDFLVLCLALYAIGREKPAAALLQARIEGILDVATKVIYLQYLAKITHMEEYELEIQYWMLVSGWKKFQHLNIYPLSECLSVSLYDQVTYFQGAGASVKGGSFAESCLLDYKTVLEIQNELNFGPLIFHAVARGGLIEEIRKAIYTKSVVRWAEKTQRDVCNTELPFKGEAFEHREMLRKIVHLASYNFLRQDKGATLTFCKQAIGGIFNFQVENPLLDLEGVLDYEIETAAFMGIEFIDTMVQDTDVRLFIDAISSQENLIHNIVSNDSIKNNAVVNKHWNLPLRQSMIFSCYGHAHRVQATKNCCIVTLSLHKEDVTGVIPNRKTMLEAAKYYVIAAALDVYDSPRIVKKYDQAIWSLLLAGGIDVMVLRLLIEVRNFHKRNLFYSYAEETFETSNSMNLNWPEFCNQFEVLEVISDLFKDCKSLEKSIRLSPTIIDYQEQLYISTTYLQFPHAFVLKNGSIVEPKHTASIKFTFAEKMDCVNASSEVAEVWYSIYSKSYKNLPLELLSFYRDRILTNSYEAEFPVMPTSIKNHAKGKESSKIEG